MPSPSGRKGFDATKPMAYLLANIFPVRYSLEVSKKRKDQVNKVSERLH